MARQPRIHVAGAVYHVIARGNNREKVFEKADDKEEYLQLLKHYKEKFPEIQGSGFTQPHNF